MASTSPGQRIGRLRGGARQREVDLVLARWHASDLGKGRFCEEEGIADQTLRRWLAAKGAEPLSTARPQPATFIEVQAPAPPSGARYEITLSCGARVLVPMGFDDAEVARLLSLAASC